MTASKRTKGEKTPVRLARASDAHTFGRLLHEFNAEFGEATPDPAASADNPGWRVRAPGLRRRQRRVGMQLRSPGAGSRFKV
jgi:hypothetical protein